MPVVVSYFALFLLISLLVYLGSMEMGVRSSYLGGFVARESKAAMVNFFPVLIPIHDTANDMDGLLRMLKAHVGDANRFWVYLAGKTVGASAKLSGDDWFGKSFSGNALAVSELFNVQQRRLVTILINIGAELNVKSRGSSEIPNGEGYIQFNAFPITANYDGSNDDGCPVNSQPRTISPYHNVVSDSVGPRRSVRSASHFAPLKPSIDGISDKESQSHNFNGKLYIVEPIAIWSVGFSCVIWGWWRIRFGGRLRDVWWGLAAVLVGIPFAVVGMRMFIVRHGNTVSQQYPLTNLNYCITVMCIEDTHMANVLAPEKQVAVIAALAEGSGIRQIERMTGINRNTIMNLGVRVGKGCAALMDAKMHKLECSHLQFDELWGFIGKKNRNLTPEDSPEMGDVRTFCAIDTDTKLVPSFAVGKRNAETANRFVMDVAGRLANRVQVSTDALIQYGWAMEQAFGGNVDFAQVVKVYEDASDYAKVIRVDKTPRVGRPDLDKATTSHVERLNGTTRLHMRRLTRLTYAFGKKLENFEAAVGLHFAYYNFVKRHSTLRCTPAMAAGIEREQWTVKELVGAAI
jgi:IS1 family transposase